MPGGAIVTLGKQVNVERGSDPTTQNIRTSESWAADNTKF